ncbi:MAG: thiol:disulfide interchange protein DsbA/DsbL [Pseudohongiellaceae bacterium]|jgi:protein dithiol oxidoreductase (disulfide-forming)
MLLPSADRLLALLAERLNPRRLPPPQGQAARRHGTSRLAGLLLSLVAACTLAQPRESVEGVHYQPLPQPVPTEAAADKIEVRELFWYGCPECATLEPLLTQWRNGVTGDLVFVRMPVVWNDLMALHARLFYTARALEAEDRLSQAAYRAVGEQQNPLRTPEQIKALFLANGIAADAFEAAWSSEAVSTAVEAARARSGDYGSGKLPAVIVNGRFAITHNAKVTDHVELNIAINNLIRKLREQRRGEF